MERRIFQSDALLLLTAIIWGFAFVAQRVGMEHVGPFTFNGIRFALGTAVLLPWIIAGRRNTAKPATTGSPRAWLGGLIVGAALFGGASLQQVGLVYTTAGNAGFITGLYVVIVPIMGAFFGQRTDAGTWLGAFLAAAGLYLLSVTEKMQIDYGDLLVLIGAFIWAAHVLLISRLSPKMRILELAALQYGICSILSLLVAVITEQISLAGVMAATVPIAYGGLFSVGIAYTLQVAGQRHAHPAHAAILLSLESVFAAFGGWWLLDEVMGNRGLVGCALMLAGMLISQLYTIWRSNRPRRTCQTSTG